MCQIMVGEALVGGCNEVAHIGLTIGPKTSQVRSSPSGDSLSVRASEPACVSHPLHSGLADVYPDTIGRTDARDAIQTLHEGRQRVPSGRMGRWPPRQQRSEGASEGACEVSTHRREGR